MLEYMKLTKKYNDNVVVNNLNLRIDAGNIIGFLGPNGAGKTTTIKMSCGINNPTSGEIIAFGKSIKKNRKEYIRNVGAVLEGNRNIYWKLTPEENMEYYANIRGGSKKLKTDIEYYLKMFDLYEKKDVECGSLSRGMQQKVSICCSLINHSKILFLDEPTLGLDVESILTMQKLIKSLISDEKIIVVTSHDLQFINNICNRVVIMNKGNIILDNSIESFKSYYNTITYDIAVNNFKNINTHEILNKSSFIKEINLEKSMIKGEFKDDNELIYMLNDLQKMGIDICGVNKIQASLEDIFLDLIKSTKEVV